MSDELWYGVIEDQAHCFYSSIYLSIFLSFVTFSNISVVRLSDRPDMTLDVYRGCKTTTQQRRQYLFIQLSLFLYLDC